MANITEQLVRVSDLPDSLWIKAVELFGPKRPVAIGWAECHGVFIDEAGEVDRSKRAVRVKPRRVHNGHRR